MLNSDNPHNDNEKMTNKVVKGISWSFAEKLLTEMISFVVTIVLARILLPEAYGTVGVLQIFITISQVFVSFGLGSALVQKSKPDKLDYSTIFLANTLIGLLLYGILFVTAPLIASFYNMPALTLMMRIMALRLPLASIYNIQMSYIQKTMQFKKLFFSSLWGTLLGGIIGIVMAKYGFGAWALVATTLIDQFIDCVTLFITTKWMPGFKFSMEKFKILNKFGWKVTFSELISRAYDQIRLLVIGKAYSPSDLAYNTKAQSFPQQIIETVNTTVVRVMFPAFSHYQDDKEQLVSTVRWSVKITSFCLSPLMIGLAAVSNQLIPLMLTESWNMCVPYLQLYCITYLFQPLQSINIKIVQAVGRSDITLKTEIVKKIFGLAAVFGALILFDSPFAVAASFSVMSLAALFINAFACKMVIGYGILHELIDILPSVLLSLVMGAAVMLVPMLGLSYLPTIIIQIAAGALIYILGALVLRFEQIAYIMNFIKNKRTKNYKQDQE